MQLFILILLWSFVKTLNYIVRNKHRLEGEGEETGGSNVRRMALIRPAIKLGLHWIGRTVCSELNGYT